MSNNMYDLIVKLTNDNASLSIIHDFFYNVDFNKINVDFERNKGAGNILFEPSNNKYKIALLLKYGVNPSFENEDGDTPLCYQSNPEILKLLLDAGADPNHKNKHGETPIFYVKNMESAKLLKEYGADIHHKNNSGESLVCSMEDLGALKYLLSEGLEIKKLDREGRSIIKYMSISSNKEKMSLLLDKGLKISHKDFSYELNRIPIDILIKIFKTHKFEEIFQENEYGMTPLSHITNLSLFLAVVENYNIDWSMKKSNGESLVVDVKIPYMLTDAFLVNLVKEDQVVKKVTVGNKETYLYKHMQESTKNLLVKDRLQVVADRYFLEKTMNENVVPSVIKNTKNRL